MKKIILASTSERRKELLQSTGLEFIVVASPYQEDMSRHDDPEVLVSDFSQGKARALVDTNPNAIIIGADTIVYLNGVIYGKPKDKNEALSMLASLQGKQHVVYTGYTVIDSETKKEVTKVETTEITLGPLSGSEIEAYFQKVPLLDKAGAYAIQGVGATFTESIKGEYSNVVGLPMASLRITLKEFGVELL